MALPHGATCVDFAYAVHTDIGNRCVAAKLNHELVPLRTELKNGDRVEIITAAHAKPNPAWLNFVVTAKARHQIRHFLRTMQYEESAQLGERLLAQALAALAVPLKSVEDARWDAVLKEFGHKSRTELLADIGLGKVLSIVIARKLAPPSRSEGGLTSGAPGPVVIRGSEGVALQFAKCCHPIPGDPIIGFIKKGRGMIIHTHDCPVVRKMKREPEKWLDVEWAPETKKLFSVNIKLLVANEPGVLAQVASEIAQNGSNIENVSLEPGDSEAYSVIYFTLQVYNRLHLAQIMRGLRRLPEVVRINRLKG
jgi:GTP pyrophosphokinase